MEFDKYPACLRRVLDRIVAKVPEHLAQVALVDAHLEIVGDVFDRQFAFL